MLSRFFSAAGRQYGLKIADCRKINEKSRSISSPVKSRLPELFEGKKRFKTPKKHPKSRSISRHFTDFKRMQQKCGFAGFLKTEIDRLF